MTVSNVKPYHDKSALYFEDQPEKNKAISDYLKMKLGMYVVLADSKEAAFKAMESHKFDLLICDIRILDGDKKQDGTEIDWRRYGTYFIEEIREGRLVGPTSASVPLLVITCVVEYTEIERIRELGESNGGHYRYLSKPIDSLDLLEKAVHELLG